MDEEWTSFKNASPDPTCSTAIPRVAASCSTSDKLPAHVLARGDQQAPVAHAAEHLGRDAGLRLFQAGGLCASGKSGDRSINQGLVGPHRHGGVAVDIDNQHEHAVVLRVRTLGQ